MKLQPTKDRADLGKSTAINPGVYHATVFDVISEQDQNGEPSWRVIWEIVSPGHEAGKNFTQWLNSVGYNFDTKEPDVAATERAHEKIFEFLLATGTLAASEYDAALKEQRDIDLPEIEDAIQSYALIKIEVGKTGKKSIWRVLPVDSDDEEIVGATWDTSLYEPTEAQLIIAGGGKKKDKGKPTKKSPATKTEKPKSSASTKSTTKEPAAAVATTGGEMDFGDI